MANSLQDDSVVSINESHKGTTSAKIGGLLKRRKDVTIPLLAGEDGEDPESSSGPKSRGA